MKSDLGLPIDEKPELVQSFMHRRMVQQATHSLNKQKVQEAVISEVSRQKIKRLRELHHNLIGVKRMTKTSTFNNVPIKPDFGRFVRGGARNHEESANPAEAAPVEEEAEESSCESDDEFINPVNQSARGISLSVFSIKNQKKAKFLNDYYHTPSKKQYPVQSRLSMTSALEHGFSKSAGPKFSQYEQARVVLAHGTPADESQSYGIKVSSQLGNISGMFIDEDDSKLLKLSNSVFLTNTKDYFKARDAVQAAVNEQNDLKEKAKQKALAKAAKKQQKKNAGKEAEEEEV